MKNSITLIFLLFTAILFAQKPTNSIFNYKESTDGLLVPNTKFSLNMDFFKLEDSKENTNSLSELLRKSYNQKTNPVNKMPIFVPEGKFFIETYDVDEDIDYKLKIFDLEKSKYFFRSMG